MRLIDNSNTRSLFESLKETNDAEQAVFDALDGTDFFVNEVYSIGNGEVKFNVSAYTYNSDTDEPEEMNRDVTVAIPNDDYNGIPQDSYEAVYNCVEAWRNEHNSPDSFYESVTIDTGSTVVTSDETGVTVEDNGNTITAGNGVTVNVDNAGDELPAEIDIASPTEELPIDEPVEELPAEEEIPAEEPTEEPVEELPEDDLDESTVNEEVLEKKDDETEEEVNNSKVEECDKQDKEKIEEIADGYDQNQNVEIYQNPEFDYQILDITELDNIDNGDIRAIDMANILNDLDESLTEAYGSSDYVKINSFLTRKGTHKKTNESYSSAILELVLPKLNESVREYKNVFFLEVYGDKPIKECIVRDSSNHIIKQYSGKAKDPVKHFEGVILDIDRARQLNEDIEFMVNEPYSDGGINFADGKAIEKDEERQENHLKQHEKMAKGKKFKVEKEPDQDNTAGKTEEEATDTVKVEKLPKAKKTKVDAKKLKVKEIKESVEDAKDIGMDEGEPEVLCVDQYNYIGPANKIDGMIRYYDMETPEWLVNKLNSYGNKIIEMSCGDHYPECFNQENCSIVREVPKEEYIEYLKRAEVPSRNTEAGKRVKQQILDSLTESTKLDEASHTPGGSTQWMETGRIVLDGGDMRDYLETTDFSYLIPRIDDYNAYYEFRDLNSGRDGFEFYKLGDNGKPIEDLYSVNYQMQQIINKVKNNQYSDEEISAMYWFCQGLPDNMEPGEKLNEEIIDNEIEENDYELERHNNEHPEDIWEEANKDAIKSAAKDFYGLTGEEISNCFREINKLVKSKDKLTEADEELLDEPIVTDGSEPEDELEESGSDVAIFHRKPASVDAMRAAEQNGITVNKSNYKIVGTKELSNDEFNQFANHLSSEDYDWLEEYNDTSNSGEFKCVEVINTDDDSYSILVDPQGYKYARYAAIKDNVDEEELLEPEEELIDETNEEETANE